MIDRSLKKFPHSTKLLVYKRLSCPKGLRDALCQTKSCHLFHNCPGNRTSAFEKACSIVIRKSVVGEISVSCCTSQLTNIHFYYQIETGVILNRLLSSRFVISSSPLNNFPFNVCLAFLKCRISLFILCTLWQVIVNLQRRCVESFACGSSTPLNWVHFSFYIFVKMENVCMPF